MLTRLTITAFASSLLLLTVLTKARAHEPTIQSTTIRAFVDEPVTVENLTSINGGAIPCQCQEVRPSADHKYIVTYQDGKMLGPLQAVDITYQIFATGADKYSARVWIVDLDNGGTSEIGHHFEKGSIGSFRAFVGPGRYAVYLQDVSATSTNPHDHGDAELSHTAYLERGAIAVVVIGKQPCVLTVMVASGDSRIERATQSSGAEGSMSVGSDVVGLGSAMHVGDAITTGAGSHVELLTPDGGRLIMGPNSSLIMDEALCEERDFSVRLAFGTMWSRFTTVVGGDSKFQVNSSNASTGCRQTIFTVEADSLRTIIRVYPEPDKNSSVTVRGTAGGEVVVHEGEETVVEKNKHPSKPQAFIAPIDPYWEMIDALRAAMPIDRHLRLDELEAPAEDDEVVPDNPPE